MAGFMPQITASRVPPACSPCGPGPIRLNLARNGWEATWVSDPQPPPQEKQILFGKTMEKPMEKPTENPGTPWILQETMDEVPTWAIVEGNRLFNFGICGL